MTRIESEQSTKLVIRFKKLKENAILPRYANPGDAGMDLFSTEDYILKPGERHTYGTGIAAEIPDDHFVRFSPKSGLAVRDGIDVMAGIIDNGYRGEWMVILINLGTVPKEINSGDKIAQAILERLERAEIEEVSELSETQRGAGRFGSTGR